MDEDDVRTYVCEIINHLRKVHGVNLLLKKDDKPSDVFTKKNFDSNDDFGKFLGKRETVFVSWDSLTPEQQKSLVTYVRDFRIKEEDPFNDGEKSLAIDFILQSIRVPTYVGKGSVDVTTINDKWGRYRAWRKQPGHSVQIGAPMMGGVTVWHKDYGDGYWCPERAFTDLTKAVLPDVNNGWTSLMGAIENGSLNEIQRLIGNGAHINAISWNCYVLNKQGKYDPSTADNDNARTVSPLLIAADLGRTDVLKYLILKGANVAITDNRGENIFVRAARQNQVETIRFLLADNDLRAYYKGKKDKELYKLIGEEIVLKKLRDESKGTVTDGNEVIDTVMTIAIKAGCSLEVIEMFTNTNILDTPDKDGKTPLVLAFERYQQERTDENDKIVCHIMSQPGVDLNQTIGNEKQPLISALIQEGNIGFLGILLERNFTFDENKKDTHILINSNILNQRIPNNWDNEPFISTLIRHKKWDAFRKADGTFDVKLLEGVRLLAQDTEGKTPLMVALEYGAPVDFIRCLREAESKEISRENANNSLDTKKIIDRYQDNLLENVIKYAQNYSGGYEDSFAGYKAIENKIKGELKDKKVFDKDVFKKNGHTSLRSIIEEGSYAEIEALLEITQAYDSGKEDDQHITPSVTGEISRKLLRNPVRLENLIKEMFGNDVFTNAIENFVSVSDLIKKGTTKDIQKLLSIMSRADRQMKVAGVVGSGIFTEAVTRLIEREKRWDLVEELMFENDGAVNVTRQHLIQILETDLEKDRKYDIIKKAAEKGIEIPFDYLIGKGYPFDFIQTLITPENADKPNADGKTPLELLLKHDKWTWSEERVNRLKCLIETGRVNLNQKIDGVPLISFLLKQEQYDLVRTVLKAGEVDLNATDEKGRTPFHIATIWENVPFDIFEKLLTLENSDKPNAYGEVPSVSLFRHGQWNWSEERVNRWKCLIEKGKINLNQKIDGVPLISALLQKRQYDLVRTVLKAGKVDLNATDENGNTPLTIAAQCHDVPNDVFNLLITDENIDKRNKEGKTPLKLLCEGYIGNEEPVQLKCIEKLISSGKVDVRQKINGVPFLLFMIQHQQYGIVENAIGLYKATDMNLSAGNTGNNSQKTPLGQKTPLDYLLDEQHWQHTDQCIGAARILIEMIKKNQIPYGKHKDVARRIQKAYEVCEQSRNELFDKDTQNMIDSWYNEQQEQPNRPLKPTPEYRGPKQQRTTNNGLSSVLHSQQEHRMFQGAMVVSTDNEQDDVIMSSLNYTSQRSGNV